MSWDSIDWQLADDQSLDAGRALLPLWPMLRSAIAEAVSADAMCPITVGDLLVGHVDAEEVPAPLVASTSFELLGTERRGSWAAVQEESGKQNALGGKTYEAARLQQLVLEALDAAFSALVGEGMALGDPIDPPGPGTPLLLLRIPLASVDGEELSLVSAYDAAVEAELSAHIAALQALAAEGPVEDAQAPAIPVPAKPEFKSPTIPRQAPGSTTAVLGLARPDQPARAVAGVPTPAAVAVAGNGGGYGGTAGVPLPPPPANVRPAQLPDLSAAPGAGNGTYNIDLLLGVNLQVAVEIGRTTLPIRDVLALTPGSIVELDKLAGEKVDVLVNGRPVAQGEVVVVDENFGVRITDVVSRQNRIAAGGGKA